MDDDREMPKAMSLALKKKNLYRNKNDFVPKIRRQHGSNTTNPGVTVMQNNYDPKYCCGLTCRVNVTTSTRKWICYEPYREPACVAKEDCSEHLQGSIFFCGELCAFQKGSLRMPDTKCRRLRWPTRGNWIFDVGKNDRNQPNDKWQQMIFRLTRHTSQWPTESSCFLYAPCA